MDSVLVLSLRNEQYYIVIWARKGSGIRFVYAGIREGYTRGDARAIRARGETAIIKNLLFKGNLNDGRAWGIRVVYAS